MKNLDFGYAQSKWVSEQLLLGGFRAGLRGSIYRPSFISPSRNGHCSPSDVILRLLAFMIDHGVAVEAPNQLSLIPVDVVADHVVAIANSAPATNEVFHLTSTVSPYTMSDLTSILSNEWGLRFQYLRTEDFVNFVVSRARPNEPIFPLLRFLRDARDKLIAMEHKRYDNSAYIAAKRRALLTVEEPGLPETVRYVLRGMVANQMIRNQWDSLHEDTINAAPPISGPHDFDARARC